MNIGRSITAVIQLGECSLDMSLDHSVVQVTPAFNFCPLQLAAANVFWISLALWNSPPEGGQGTGNRLCPAVWRKLELEKASMKEL